MNISDAQREIRIRFCGGFYGQLVSGVLWLLSGCLAVTVGANGQTNFVVSTAVYPTGFYRAIWDTNGIPVWQMADPNNPGAGILAVFIDSPTNGAVIQ